MKTLLVPLDGSALARQALPYARMLATVLSARIHLLRVISTADKDHMLMSPSMVLHEMGEALETSQARQNSIWARMIAYTRDQLMAEAQLLRDDGLDVHAEVQIGSPAEIITSITHHEPVSLIVMSTHGYSGLRRWTLGSVADRVVQTTTTPIFLVRGNESFAETEELLHLKRIMVPLDGSPLARAALPCAIELATCARAELLLLRAIRPMVLDEYYVPVPMAQQPSAVEFETVRANLRQEAVQDLNVVAGEMRHYDLPLTTHVVSGYPAEVIVDEAARHAIDVIVMATHGYGGIRRWALGSVADKVLHATTTPLVLIHAHETEN